MEPFRLEAHAPERLTALSSLSCEFETRLVWIHKPQSGYEAIAKAQAYILNRLVIARLRRYVFDVA
jgi:hypothetical protein